MSSFRSKLTNSFQFGLFKLSRLPLAFVAGLKVKEIDQEKAVVTIRHNYFTKNPFRSIYFAAQAMAAELSTGALVMDRVQQAKPKRISMLVFDMEASFTKKATGKIAFECRDGKALDELIERILQSDEGETIKMESVGKNEQGEVVSTFSFTWTLKEKRSSS